MMLGPENCMVMSPAPEAKESTLRVGLADVMYRTSVKPSAFKKSSAIKIGARQMLTTLLTGMRIVVVSSVSAASVGEAGLTPHASNRANPAADRPSPAETFKNWRRL